MPHPTMARWFGLPICVLPLPKKLGSAITSFPTAQTETHPASQQHELETVLDVH